MTRLMIALMVLPACQGGEEAVEGSGFCQFHVTPEITCEMQIDDFICHCLNVEGEESNCHCYTPTWVLEECLHKNRRPRIQITNHNTTDYNPDWDHEGAR